MMDEVTEILPTDWKPENSMIKVIGVGGGGCNAVTYMYNQKIQGCSFIVCNTDSQALEKSNVPIKIPLGDGLGAGTKPDRAKIAASESQELIAKTALDNGTRMLFITTVAVVTIPFKEEGRLAMAKANDGILELKRHVDSLLIINNEKLYSCFGTMLLQEAWPKADEILATAVRGIIEIIKKPGFINVDFQDVITMMKNSGMALMGCGTGKGKNRLEDAVKQALVSPLLNDFDLKTAKNRLINITVGRNDKGLTMEELNAISKLVAEYTGEVEKSKRGIIMDDDPEFGDTVRITVIATGFQANISEITGGDYGKIIPIPKDFTYTDEYTPQSGEISLSNDTEPTFTKIGTGTNVNCPHFHYDSVPVLVVEPGTDTSALTENSALSRSAIQTSGNAERF